MSTVLLITKHANCVSLDNQRVSDAESVNRGRDK